MIDASLRVLRTDVSGMPVEWIGFEDAVRLHCLEQVLYPMGSVLYHVRGGINARSGEQSTLAIHSILCTAGQSR
ncbi:MAG: HNH endonuclease, partial [Arenicellales bacterium]